MKKKLCSAASALLTAAMLVPVAAFADTTISPTGGSPFDISPNPASADATVKFSVDPTYTVTIPASFTLADDGSGIYTNSGNVTADSVFLEEGKKIVISLTSASKFNMKTADTATYQLPYTASTEEFGKLTDKENGGIVAEFTTAKDAQTAEITFTTDEEPQYAGVYSDPVTFTLEVADA